MWVQVQPASHDGHHEQYSPFQSAMCKRWDTPKRIGPEEWLVVTRRSLTADRPLEPRASRDATDQDTRYRYHYYLTPTCGGEVELAEPSLAELARVIKAGACIEA